MDPKKSFERLPVIEVDRSPERAHTLGGGELWRRVLIRSIWLGAVFAAAPAAFLLASQPNAYGIRIALLCSSLFYLGALGLYGITPINEYFFKRALSSKYGLNIKIGVDSWQRREFRVPSPPGDLTDLVESALRALGNRVTVERVDTNHFTARRKREGFGPTRLAVELRQQEDGSVVGVVTSEPDGRGLFGMKNDRLRFNGGRSIENVEEFQLALRGLLQRSALAGEQQPVLRDVAQRGSQ